MDSVSYKKGGKMKAKHGARVKILKEIFCDYLLKETPTMKSKICSKQVELLEMPWRTENNFVDCGIFAMRHMETYYGTSIKDWNCGLSKESENQKLQLIDLRYKYLTKILLSNINQLRDKVISKVKEYAALHPTEREMMKLKARQRIKERMRYSVC